MIKSFRDLDVWQASMDLVDMAYDLSERFPRHEMFGLGREVRRSAISIPSNIAEGSRQRTTPGKIHSMATANASDAELETQLEIALRRRYVTERDIRRAQALANQISKMLYGLVNSLEGQRDGERR